MKTAVSHPGYLSNLAKGNKLRSKLDTSYDDQLASLLTLFVVSDWERDQWLRGLVWRYFHCLHLAPLSCVQIWV